MVDIASRVMIGESLISLGFGTGLYKTPPYFAVKVPVFSFEKLSDVNATLGPEMKSTGEVLGIGKTLTEALFKGLSAAGFKLAAPFSGKEVGILLSVVDHDLFEVVTLAKKLDDLGMKLYATPDTANAIAGLGIDVTRIDSIVPGGDAFRLMEEGKLNYIVYTGALYDSTIEEFITLHRRAVQLSIACLTSLDTANAMADIIASRYNLYNTELVDINDMRTQHRKLSFSKMCATGNDYIYIDNFDGSITCPESLCVTYCDRHYGIGGDGIVLIEKSKVATAKMRIFNQDGSEGKMAGNPLRCVGKFLYDNGYTTHTHITIETASGVKKLKLYISDGKVTSVCVHMGKAVLDSTAIPVALEQPRVINTPAVIGGETYRITCVSVGNPHCIVFAPRVDGVEVEKVGPLFEHSPLFPERVNTEFIRVVNPVTIKMRVWERGNGETLACGTGACAAVVAAVENGFCPKGEDITVKVRGGDLIVNYTDDEITLTGNADLIYKGELEY